MSPRGRGDTGRLLTSFGRCRRCLVVAACLYFLACEVRCIRSVASLFIYQPADMLLEPACPHLLRGEGRWRELQDLSVYLCFDVKEYPAIAAFSLVFDVELVGLSAVSRSVVVHSILFVHLSVLFSPVWSASNVPF